MCKSDTNLQTSIFDAICLSEIKKNYFHPMSRKYYTALLLSLTRLFCNDVISTDEYKDYLHLLCENYRKDFKNVKS